MDITARNEIYITSGSQGSIKGITEEPTHCATAVLSFFPAKHFFQPLYMAATLHSQFMCQN